MYELTGVTRDYSKGRHTVHALQGVDLTLDRSHFLVGDDQEITGTAGRVKNADSRDSLRPASRASAAAIRHSRVSAARSPSLPSRCQSIRHKPW